MHPLTKRVFIDTGSDYLTTPELAGYLNVGLSTARKISAAAKATVKVQDKTRHYRPLIDKYMKQQIGK